MQMNRRGWQKRVDNLCGTESQFGKIAPGSPIHRVELGAGLTNDEVIAVDSRFGFQSPPDLREFLQTAVPRGPEFPGVFSCARSHLAPFCKQELSRIRLHPCRRRISMCV